MKLLVDMGNTLVKWQLRDGAEVVTGGAGLLEDSTLFARVHPYALSIQKVAVSTVASERRRALLDAYLSKFLTVPILYYWAEAERSGLQNAYSQPAKMGADRWHAMYGAWCRDQSGFMVVDAGSAITVDFVASGGVHTGGYILAGRQMMLRALSQDAARIDYQDAGSVALDPGKNTTDCVFHGLAWVWRALADRLNAEAAARSLTNIFVTGGDAWELMSQGLVGVDCRHLVLDGLAAISSEDPE